MSTSVATRLAPAPRARLFGISILNVRCDAAVATITERLARREPTRVVFVNADCVNIAFRDPAYRDTLLTSELCFGDGVGLRIAGRVLGAPLCDNVNGTDLFPLLCSALAASHRRIYLLGAKPRVAAGVADWITTRHPGLTVAGYRDGYFSADEAPAVVATIAASHPDVLLVAMGAPRQELWLREHLGETGATVGIGVGGLFDFFSGRIPRAPSVWRRLGLEWLYRLTREPKRLWRRYLLGNPLFLARLLAYRLGAYGDLDAARHR